jgi:hypothetical protein
MYENLIAFCSNIEPVGPMNAGNLLRRSAKKASRSRGTKEKKGEAAYLFGVSLSSVKRYARAWSVPSLTEGKHD